MKRPLTTDITPRPTNGVLHRRSYDIAITPAHNHVTNNGHPGRDFQNIRDSGGRSGVLRGYSGCPLTASPLPYPGFLNREAHLAGFIFGRAGVTRWRAELISARGRVTCGRADLSRGRAGATSGRAELNHGRAGWNCGRAALKSARERTMSARERINPAREGMKSARKGTTRSRAGILTPVRDRGNYVTGHSCPSSGRFYGKRRGRSAGHDRTRGEE